jgi:hypothetical protein
MLECLQQLQNQEQHRVDKENLWEQRERKNKKDSKNYLRCYSQKEPNLEGYRKDETEAWLTEEAQSLSVLSV